MSIIRIIPRRAGKNTVKLSRENTEQKRVGRVPIVIDPLEPRMPRERSLEKRDRS